MTNVSDQELFGEDEEVPAFPIEEDDDAEPLPGVPADDDEDDDPLFSDDES
jgi:hypothetical protein